MLEGGNIIRIKDFDFEDGESPLRDKFLIVLLKIDGISIIAPLTTSKDYLPDNYKNQKCVKEDNSGIHCYYIKANYIIGTSGFSFPKDTFIHIQSSNLTQKKISDFSTKYIDTNQAELKDKLTNTEYSDFIYCVYKSSFVPRGIKRLLEPIIESLENQNNSFSEKSPVYNTN